jgi:geranylgeranyl pyrophosphate synthase
MNMTAQQHSVENGFPLEIDRVIMLSVAAIEPPPLREVLRQSTAGGKRLRPMLTALACAAAGGQEADTLEAGAALELLHASSLVHDDIMDQSELRRGMPTAYRQHGVPMAIVAGDALLALAFRMIQRVKSPRKGRIVETFTDCFLNLCEGQSADILPEASSLGDAESHRWMVERKTARLVEACTRIGAFLGTGDEHLVNALSRFGLSLGLAYQATDDLLDAIGNEQETGKSVGTDLLNGRRTFLTLAYPYTDRLAAIRTTVEAYTAEALQAMDLVPRSPARERLSQLARALLDRKQ